MIIYLVNKTRSDILLLFTIVLCHNISCNKISNAEFSLFHFSCKFAKIAQKFLVAFTLHLLTLACDFVQRMCQLGGALHFWLFIIGFQPHHCCFFVHHCFFSFFAFAFLFLSLALQYTLVFAFLMFALSLYPLSLQCPIQMFAFL